jgi:hypothetical protein
MKGRKILHKWDVLLLLTVLLAALAWAWLGAARAGAEAEILLDGKVARTLRLDTPEVFSLPQRPQVVFEVRDGAIAFIHSNCPDQVCVRTGFIRQGGQQAACLPNRLVARVLGGPDAVAGW